MLPPLAFSQPPPQARLRRARSAPSASADGLSTRGIASATINVTECGRIPSVRPIYAGTTLASVGPSRRNQGGSQVNRIRTTIAAVLWVSSIGLPSAAAAAHRNNRDRYEDRWDRREDRRERAENRRELREDRYEARRNYWDAARYYRRDTRYRPRQLGRNDRIYRGSDSRYYCRRDDGTTGLIVGAVSGGVLGNIIAPGDSKTIGTLSGAGAGALIGRAVDAGNIICE